MEIEMSREHVYNIKTDNTAQILELHNQGYKILCPKCKSELLVVPDKEAAIRHQTRPGIYCTVNQNHICQWFVLASERRKFWDTYNEIMSKNDVGQDA
jgi:RNase P subunit RPR2